MLEEECKLVDIQDNLTGTQAVVVLDMQTDDIQSGIQVEAVRADIQADIQAGVVQDTQVCTLEHVGMPAEGDHLGLEECFGL